MGCTDRYCPTRKPKLPRRRKKRAIEAEGRKWYHDTIRLYRLTQASGKFYEPVCKFWMNASVRQGAVEVGGRVLPTVFPTRYW